MCTSLTVPYEGGFIFGYHTNFTLSPKINLMFMPRYMDLGDNINLNAADLQLRTQYAVLGIKSYGDLSLNTGMNEYGLMGSAHYAPSVLDYPSTHQQSDSFTMASYEVLPFILGNCQNIADIRKFATNIEIVNLPLIESGLVLPLHWAFTDKNGQQLVLQYQQKQWAIYDNPLGVLTNTAEFPWLLQKFQHLLAQETRDFDQIDNEEFHQHFLANNEHSVDSEKNLCSTIRFMHAAYCLKNLPNQTSNTDAAQQAFQLFNTLTIANDLYFEHTQQNTEETLYSAALNPNDLMMSVHTPDPLQTHHFSFTDFDIFGKSIIEKPITGQIYCIH